MREQINKYPLSGNCTIAFKNRRIVFFYNKVNTIE